MSASGTSIVFEQTCSLGCGVICFVAGGCFSYSVDVDRLAGGLNLVGAFVALNKHREVEPRLILLQQAMSRLQGLWALKAEAIIVLTSYA